MYRITAYCQLITWEWIHTSTTEMDLEVARAVMDRISDRLYQQLRNKKIKNYRVEITNAE